jgi:hypothetical protein
MSITGRHMAPIIIITGRVITIPRVITGGRLATFITTILVGTAGTGGIIIGGTTEEIGDRTG